MIKSLDLLLNTFDANSVQSSVILDSLLDTFCSATDSNRLFVGTIPAEKTKKSNNMTVTEYVYERMFEVIVSKYLSANGDIGNRAVSLLLALAVTDSNIHGVLRLIKVLMEHNQLALVPSVRKICSKFNHSILCRADNVRPEQTDVTPLYVREIPSIEVRMSSSYNVTVRRYPNFESDYLTELNAGSKWLVSSISNGWAKLHPSELNKLTGGTDSRSCTSAFDIETECFISCYATGTIMFSVVNAAVPLICRSEYMLCVRKERDLGDGTTTESMTEVGAEYNVARIVDGWAELSPSENERLGLESREQPYYCQVFYENDAYMWIVRTKSASEMPDPDSIQDSRHEHPLMRMSCKMLPVAYGGTAFDCNICHEIGQGYVYRCSLCDFDAHPSCVVVPSPASKEPQQSFDCPVVWCDKSNASLTFNEAFTTVKHVGNASTFPSAIGVLPSTRCMFTVKLTETPSTGRNYISFGLVSKDYFSDEVGIQRGIWGIFDDRSTSSEACICNYQDPVGTMRKLVVGDILQMRVNTVEGWCEFSLNRNEVTHRFTIPPSDDKEAYTFVATLADDTQLDIIPERIDPDPTYKRAAIVEVNNLFAESYLGNATESYQFLLSALPFIYRKNKLGIREKDLRTVITTLIDITDSHLSSADPKEGAVGVIKSSLNLISLILDSYKQGSREYTPYPRIFKSGDIVKRGDHWSGNDDDRLHNQCGLGKVIGYSLTGDVTVCWLESGLTVSYRYCYDSLRSLKREFTAMKLQMNIVPENKDKIIRLLFCALRTCSSSHHFNSLAANESVNMTLLNSVINDIVELVVPNIDCFFQSNSTEQYDLISALLEMDTNHKLHDVFKPLLLLTLTEMKSTSILHMLNHDVDSLRGDSTSKILGNCLQYITTRVRTPSFPHSSHTHARTHSLTHSLTHS